MKDGQLSPWDLEEDNDSQFHKLLYNNVLEFLSRAIRLEKAKAIQIIQENVEPSLFSDDMILYIQNPVRNQNNKEHTRGSKWI